MDEASVMLFCALVVAIWRSTMLFKGCRKCVDSADEWLCTSVLERLLPHREWQHTCCFQWYFFAWIALSLNWARAFYDVGKYDYAPCRFQQRCFQQLWERQLQSSLIWSAALAPLVASFAFLSNLWHMVIFVRSQKEEAEPEAALRHRTLADLEDGMLAEVITGLCTVQEDGNEMVGTIVAIDNDDSDLQVKVDLRNPDGSHRMTGWYRKDRVRKYVEETNPWFLRQSAELTLLVIMTPAMFAVLALRAEIRVLEALSGSTFDRSSETWQEYKLWRVGTYTADLEVAAAFQYLTVLAFALLCTKFFGLQLLAKRVEMTENALILQNNKLRSRLGEQGSPVVSSLMKDLCKADAEHRETLIGAGLQGLWSYIIVGVLRIALNLGLNTWSLFHGGHWPTWGLKVLQQFQPVFVFTALLCIYNWGIIQSLPDLRRQEAFGRHATKKFMGVRLLLLIGDGQKGALTNPALMGLLGLSTNEEALLLHSVCLALECLLVVVWNFWQWRERVQPSWEAPSAVERRSIVRALTAGSSEALLSAHR